MEVLDLEAWTAARRLDSAVRNEGYDTETVAALQRARRRFTAKAWGLDEGVRGNDAYAPPLHVGAGVRTRGVVDWD